MLSRSGNKILVIIIVVLLLINIGMLVYFLNAPQERGIRSNIRAAIPNYLKNEMKFSSQQMELFDSLSRVQREKFKASVEEMRADKLKEFKQLGATGFDDSTINAMSVYSLRKQQALELRFFQYIKDVRKICTPEQQVRFDTSFYKILDRK